MEQRSERNIKKLRYREGTVVVELVPHGDRGTEAYVHGYLVSGAKRCKPIHHPREQEEVKGLIADEIKSKEISFTLFLMNSSYSE